ncbi:hypothetical protein ACFE04_025604 [Oxalis oulophora]
MATSVIGGSFSSVLFSPSQLGNSSLCLSKRNNLLFKPSRLTVKIPSASYSTFVEIKPTDQPGLNNPEEKVTPSSRKNVLACPICYHPLTLIRGASSFSAGSTHGSTLQCNSCDKVYSANASHLDLTTTSGSNAYGEQPMPLATEFFRSPFISFLYERGWRQNFILGGFPGSEKEFEMMKDILKPTFGGSIVDASCGSGLFARLFAKSGLFSQVVALDYSESMLEQCYNFIKQDKTFPKDDVMLVRADIARLPFISGSIDAVHAGAAIHCWPSPTSAVAEISRVLRPGGTFVGTTYILDGPFSFIPFMKEIRKGYSPLTGNQLFLAESDLEDICRASGLIDFKCIRNRRFVMYSASKPA